MKENGTCNNMNDITPAEFERLERERIAREAPFDRLLDALCVLFFVLLAARLIYAQFWQHVNVIGAVVQDDRNVGSGFAMLLQPTWLAAAFWIGYILILFSPMIADAVIDYHDRRKKGNRLFDDSDRLFK